MGWFSNNDSDSSDDKAADIYEQISMMHQANKAEVEETGHTGFFFGRGDPEQN